MPVACGLRHGNEPGHARDLGYVLGHEHAPFKVLAYNEPLLTSNLY